MLGPVFGEWENASVRVWSTACVRGTTALTASGESSSKGAKPRRGGHALHREFPGEMEEKMAFLRQNIQEHYKRNSPSTAPYVRK